MKKHIFLICLLIPLLCVSQPKDNLPNNPITQSRLFLFDQHVLDSIVTLSLAPSSYPLSKSYYTYYNNGNLKTSTLYGYFNSIKKVLNKYEYEYDNDDRIKTEVEFDPSSDTTLIPSNKITTQWFNHEYFNERISYQFEDNLWVPASKIINPELGQTDYYTTFSFNWNSSDQSWDSVSKEVYYLNAANKEYEVYKYQPSQDYWYISSLTVKKYNNSDFLIHDTIYDTFDNGATYVLQSFTDYGYTTNNSLAFREINYGLPVYQWFDYRWFYDTLNRLEVYSHSYQTPAHPEPQGGIVYKNYYDERGLIHHRNNYSTSSQNHLSTSYYYYSEFTVGIDELNKVRIKCYPNPTSSTTNFDFSLNEPSTVRISIYNSYGNLVELISENQSSGPQKVTWDVSCQTPGIYFYRFKAGDIKASGKLIVTR